MGAGSSRISRVGLHHGPKQWMIGRESWARSYFERCTESTVRDRLRIEFRDQGGELSSRFETIESPEKLNLQRNTSVINSDEQRRRGVELRRAHRSFGNCFVLCQLYWYGANEEQLRSRRYLEPSALPQSAGHRSCSGLECLERHASVSAVSLVDGFSRQVR